MATLQYVYWEDEGWYLGYFTEYPDYWTQAETLRELEENLSDLYKDLVSGEIPGIRRVAELTIS